MAYTLDSLIADLKHGAYKPKTEEELQGIAGRRYQSFYDQQRLGATQAAETADLALNRQKSNLQVDYAKQKQASEKAFTDTYTQANRQAQSRGMQRSSYNNAVLGNIGVAGAKAQADIGENQSRAIGGVEDQRTLLAQQLAGQLRQYSSAQAADTLAYIDELESKEYERGTQAQQYENSLASQIYQFANQEKTQDEAQKNWLKTFNQNAKQFDKTFAQQGKQWDKTFNENIRQFNENLTFQQRQADQTQSNWLRQFEESTRQYNTTLAENIRQYNASLTQQERERQMNSDQFQQTLAENIRQYNETMAENQRQHNETLAENQRQFDETSASSNSSTTSGDDTITTLGNDMNRYLNVNGNNQPINGAPPYNQNLEIDTNNPPAPPAFTLPKPPSLLDLHRPPVKKIVLPTKPSQQRISGLTR